MIADAFKFPEINSILRWKDLFSSFNKIALIAVAAAVIGTVVFLIAGSKSANEAPKGVRNLAETTVEFIENGIVRETMGNEGLGWTPFLLSLFVFVYLCNAPGIIPILQMPATARIAIPMFLALFVWVVYMGVGFKHQGIKYFTHTVWPPGVPTALKPLVGLIELVSNYVVRPFSLTVRLFANMLAGHITLKVFAGFVVMLLGAGSWAVISPLPFLFMVGLMALELLVAFLQAYVFAMLTCMYINDALHPGH